MLNLLKVLKLLFILVLISCSHHLEDKNKEVNFSKEEPAWVREVAFSCGLENLCALGSASGPLGAESSARVELAKIFEVEVLATTSANEEAELANGLGKMTEEFKTMVTERTSEVLKGVQIIKRHKGENEYFALAQVSKITAASSFIEQIKEIDDYTEGWYKDGRRAALNRILSLYILRSKLNDRYDFLTGGRVKRPYPLQEILRLKKRFRDSKVKISVSLKKTNQLQTDLYQTVVGLLLENDYLISEKNADFKMMIDLKERKEHLNIEGFVKYRYELSIRSVDKKGQKVGGLDFSVVKNGRSKKQSSFLALKAMRVFLNNKLDELNID